MAKNQKRRDFLKTVGLGAGSLASTSVLRGHNPHPKRQEEKPVHNMCGYKAPPMETVRIGIIGLGMRGPGAVKRLSLLEGTEIVALGDIRPERVADSQNILKELGKKPAGEFSGDENAWKKMCERKDIDLIYICTPWNWHTPMALYAMECGKHAATEVPAATTTEDSWKLVDTSERTKKHCMMLENCCYDFFEMMTLNMVRQGILGEIVHGEGAYIHDLRELKMLAAEKGGYYDYWRLKQSLARNGNLYPTHGLGPIAQCMDINRGDRFIRLTSLSSNQFNMTLKAREQFPQFADKNFRLGDMSTTLIKTEKGRSLMIQHDTSSPRPYSRIHLLSGSKGIVQKWPEPSRIALDGNGHAAHEWLKPGDYEQVVRQYEHPLSKRLGKLARTIPGAHGGMDFIMDWRLVYCLRNGEALDQDVYDAAAWSAVSPLSEESVASESSGIDFPDFTRGAWKQNSPLGIIA